MHSALYFGRVRHRRVSPQPHSFRYGLFMVYLDLAELDQVFTGRWFWSTRRAAPARFCRGDYLGDASISLDEAVRRRVTEVTGQRPAGPIRMLTHLRYFGHVFNPVTFYYVHDAADTRVETIVAEITNTPWKERHSYVLPQRADTAHPDVHRHTFEKDFHVSPFMPMEQSYDWRFSTPRETLSVHMENLERGSKVFDATLALERRPITGLNLARALVQFPLMTVQVVTAIHWQALKLWLKRIPFHTHPSKLAPAASTSATPNAPQESTP